MAQPEVDMVAVQRDAVIVQTLASRSIPDGGIDDPIVVALAAWVAQIDAGIDETVRFVVPEAAGRDLTLAQAPRRRGKHATLLAGSTVFALVVSGGAAAAVTGDPLAVVRAPLHALGTVNPFADEDSTAAERLPNQTPEIANANKLLADAHRAMGQGDPDEAAQLIAEAQAQLGDSTNPGQQNRIDKLTDRLSGGPGKSTSHPVHQNDPKGKGPADKKTHGPKDPNGKGPVDKPDHGAKDPNGKGPADKKTNQPPAKGLGKSHRDQHSTKDDAATKQAHTSNGKSGRNTSTDHGSGHATPGRAKKSPKATA